MWINLYQFHLRNGSVRKPPPLSAPCQRLYAWLYAVIRRVYAMQSNRLVIRPGYTPLYAGYTPRSPNTYAQNASWKFPGRSTRWVSARRHMYRIWTISSGNVPAGLPVISRGSRGWNKMIYGKITEIESNKKQKIKIGRDPRGSIGHMKMLAKSGIDIPKNTYSLILWKNTKTNNS